MIRTVVIVYLAVACTLVIGASNAYAQQEESAKFDYRDEWLNLAWHIPFEEAKKQGRELVEQWDYYRRFPKSIEFSFFFDSAKVDDTKCEVKELGLKASFVTAGKSPTLQVSCKEFKPFFVQQFINENIEDRGRFIAVAFDDDSYVPYYRDNVIAEWLNFIDSQRRRDWGSE